MKTIPKDFYPCDPAGTTLKSVLFTMFKLQIITKWPFLFVQGSIALNHYFEYEKYPSNKNLRHEEIFNIACCMATF